MQFDAAPKNNSVCTNGSHQKIIGREGSLLPPFLLKASRLKFLTPSERRLKVALLP